MTDLQPADRQKLLDSLQRQYDAVLDTFPAELRPDMIRSYGREDLNSPGLLSLVALPFWVGNRLHISDSICRDMAVGNLFLLHSFQSFDFVIDDDRPGTSIRSQIVLGNLCQLQVMNYYRPYFPSNSLFWERVECYWQEWGQSILWESGEDASQRSFTETHLLLAAHKSAALKICPTGLALLANEPALIPQLEQGIDLMHAAMQLIDDLTDWREDWQRQRYNSFLSWLRMDQSLAAAHLFSEEEIAAIMMSGGTLRRYAGVVHAYAAQAACVIDDLNIVPWSQLVRSLGEQAAWLAEKYERLMESFVLEKHFTNSQG